jgi:hypothetical protein
MHTCTYLLHQVRASNHICMHPHGHTYTLTYMHAYKYTYMHTHTYSLDQVRASNHICMHSHGFHHAKTSQQQFASVSILRTCKNKCQMCVYIYIHIYICMYVYVCIYIYHHAYTSQQQFASFASISSLLRSASSVPAKINVRRTVCLHVYTHTQNTHTTYTQHAHNFRTDNFIDQ